MSDDQTLTEADMREIFQRIAENMRDVESTLRLTLQPICERYGYGRVMQLASQMWAEKNTDTFPGSEHTVGPCRALMVKCEHLVKDENGHCEVCCGSGLVTKYVSRLVVGGAT